MRKVLLVNDLSGYGRCSVNLQMPVIAACGDKPCVALTSYLSSHTGYDDVYKVDLSVDLKKTFASWNKNNFKFDASITGYMSNANSILDVKEFLSDQKLENEHMINMIDPVLGDNGKLYSGLDSIHIINMRKLATIADIITPNLTEACLLTDVDYEEVRLKLGILEYSGQIDEKDPDSKKKIEENLKNVSDRVIKGLRSVLDKIIFKRVQATIITGIELYNCVVTLLDIYNGDTKQRQTTCNFMPKLESRPGTGDLFDALFLELSFKGYNLIDCLKLSTSVVQESLKYSTANNIPKNEGPAIEPILVPNLEYIRTHTSPVEKNKNNNGKGVK